MPFVRALWQRLATALYRLAPMAAVLAAGTGLAIAGSALAEGRPGAATLLGISLAASLLAATSLVLTKRGRLPDALVRASRRRR